WRAQNRGLIRSNSYVVYLQRDLESLCTDGRPLSAGGIDALKALHQTRDPLYRAVSDLIVDNNGDPEQTVKTILKELGYEDTGH
ncbi:MAG: shikimate dehydrogenase, partial [Clostridia bacterium]|nr:shikimate dehydrogenase [Clostridia bacterium]